MTLPGDLTRWNRAGLREFRYINGNAAEYLETLRQLFAARFPDWSAGIAGDETQLPTRAQQQTARETRVLKQYHLERHDWAWEIARSFARSSHVLTEMMNAYANEGYIATASQWDNLRRLVEMLDYHPAPPASASTLLVLTTKATMQGTVDKGFQVKYAPPKGDPIIFETLDDLSVDVALNELRLKDYDQAQDLLSGNELQLDELVEDLQPGTPLVLEDTRSDYVQAYLIDAVRLEQGNTTVRLSRPIPKSQHFLRGTTRVHLQPAEVLLPHAPVMDGVVSAPGAPLKRLWMLDTPDGLQVGDVVYITDGSHHYYRKVDAITEDTLDLNRGLANLNLSQATVSIARQLPVASKVERRADEFNIYALRVVGDLSSLQGQFVADAASGKENTVFEISAAVYTPVMPGNANSGYSTLRLLDNHGLLENPQILLVPPGIRQWRVASYLRNDIEKPLSKTVITNLAKKSVVGDLAVVVTGAQYAWGRLHNLITNKEQGQTILNVAQWFDFGGGRYYVGQTRLYSHFKKQSHLRDWNRNTTPVNGRKLRLNDQPPTSLRFGRTLYIEQQTENGFSSGLETQIIDVQDDIITIKDDLTGKGYTCANLVIRGNVVKAGHGERRPVKVLGGGDATQSHQSFVLAVPDVSFVADATQSSGVRADIEVAIEDRIWTQVATLRDSQPSDAHYTVHMTEEGYLRITFGNGVHGRRLPTGKNNIRVAYRQGVGLTGKVDAGKLEKPLSPHRLISSVRQPLPALGGNDMEWKESLRHTAPATLLTLERAVSIEDFANLAASHSSVWQARAFLRQNAGRLQVVEVVVLPAGGGELGELTVTLNKFLQAHALPQVQIQLRPYRPVPLSIKAKLIIDTQAFNSDTVKTTVQQALLNSFNLEQRGIGQSLYLSEVYKVVEGVRGVSKSICTIETSNNPTDAPGYIKGINDDIKLIQPDDDQVVYLDTLHPALILEVEELNHVY